MVRHYPRPRVVVSKYVEFDPCRYDGSKIPSPTVDHLKSFVDFLPVVLRLRSASVSPGQQ